MSQGIELADSNEKLPAVDTGQFDVNSDQAERLEGRHDKSFFRTGGTKNAETFGF